MTEVDRLQARAVELEARIALLEHWLEETWSEHEANAAALVQAIDIAETIRKRRAVRRPYDMEPESPASPPVSTP